MDQRRARRVAAEGPADREARPGNALVGGDSDQLRRRHPLILARLRSLAIYLASLAAPLAAQQGVAAFVPPVPTPASFVADQGGVVSAEARGVLDARIRALQDSGYGDIGIAILRSIGDYAPSEVGVAIYRAWKIGRVDSIGSARRDLGVLLLIVPKELAPDGKGQCWITTGTGAEGIVTDGASGAICRDAIIPLLKERAYDRALLAGVEAIAERLHGDEGLTAAGPDDATPPRDEPASPFWWLIPGGLLGGGGATVGALAWRRRRPRSCPTCGGTMRRLAESHDNVALDDGQALEEKLKSVDYDVWRCPDGHDLIIPYRRWFSSYHQCPACKRRTQKRTQTTLVAASYSHGGTAEELQRCLHCGVERTRTIHLPKLERSSSSSSSGGGGGGGSSFGGSGSTSGGGGGSSY